MEKAIIVAVFDLRRKEYEIKTVLEELHLLTESAGGEVAGFFYQKREAPDKKYHIGRGKAAEIKNAAYAKGVELIVFYNHLSNMRQRNLERFFKIKVIDRTRLILDIFATRARTLEGKLQVELALLLYHLPRLTGKGSELSRLGGGIGTRGPGETKLEVDRRTIHKRIARIKKRLNKVIKDRGTRRKSRSSNPVPVVSLVGYTSAGKSTLFKTLTGEDVPVSKKLFSTLDPILRKVELREIEEGYYFLLSDTVGFIRDMPKELFKAFKATLEEVIQSDLLLHVVDIANPDYLERKQEVQKVLADLHIPEEKVIYVYNKIDMLDDCDSLLTEPGESNRVESKEIFISAKENRGIKALKKEIFEKYFGDYALYKLVIPQGVINMDVIRRWAIVVKKNINNNMMEMEILCLSEKMIKFKEKYGGYLR